MGLRESLMMVGNGLGVEFESVSHEVIQPISRARGSRPSTSPVAGPRWPAFTRPIYGRKINVSLELRMYVGAEDVAAIASSCTACLT